jgi:hypothetical protein
LDNQYTGYFGWCLAHARKHGNKPQVLMAALSGFIPPIGIPVYFYSNFGFKTGSIKLFLTLLYFFLLIFVSVVFEKIGQVHAS